MKLQHIKIVLLFAFTLLAAACEKDIAAYKDEPRVYFFERATDLTQTRITFKSFSFVTLPLGITRDTFLVKVKVMGDTASRDRIVRGRAIATGTTAAEGKHYDFIDGIVPAGTVIGYIPVVLHRTEDIKDTSVTLNLGVAATADFKQGVGEDSSITLTWSDNVVKPANWDALIGLSYYFGTYSAAKWRFIISVTGKDNFPLQQSGRIPPKEGEYTNAGMLDLNAVLKQALKAYNNANDPDLTDERGQLVTFPL
ncbi:DUF4843 domain-containing protein [Chitinophaga horti]|uniref:DUF4843 domain-containing protein n=1 Tax=Chitinophaga horti TaxID=2920382 RepID=A0ABY6JB86_9BACT|nr:DUF4843 domain-containing protein [Chitinophaga horti]UYQ95842.1 DUF4843 domain-containing protein [Chitinophaga horti]